MTQVAILYLEDIQRRRNNDTKAVRRKSNTVDTTFNKVIRHDKVASIQRANHSEESKFIGGSRFDYPKSTIKIRVFIFHIRRINIDERFKA